jgi:hypothetical protein
MTKEKVVYQPNKETLPEDVRLKIELAAKTLLTPKSKLTIQHTPSVGVIRRSLLLKYSPIGMVPRNDYYGFAGSMKSMTQQFSTLKTWIITGVFSKGAGDDVIFFRTITAIAQALEIHSLLYTVSKAENIYAEPVLREAGFEQLANPKNPIHSGRKFYIYAWYNPKVGKREAK